MSSGLCITLITLAIVMAFVLLLASIDNRPPKNKRRAHQVAKIIQRALEDSEMRAAIYDAMEQERFGREYSEDEPKRKLHE